MAEINQAEYSPALRYTSRTTQTWTVGTTHTITDANIKADSIIFVMNIDIPVGHWKYTISSGSVLITSTDVETGKTFKYLIF